MSDAKILFVTPFDSGGGAERHLLSLAKCLQDDLSADVEVAVMMPQESREIEVKSVHYLGKLPKLFPSGVRALCSYRALAKLIDETQPVAIYSCLDWSNIVVGLLKLFSGRSFKWIAGLQNPLVARKHAPKLSGLFRYPLHDYLLRRTDLVVVPSAGLVEDLKLLGVKQERIKVVANVVTLPTSLSQASVTRGDKAFQLGFCARLVPQKNPFAALRVIERLQDDFSVELHIVGAGPLETKMKQFCATRGISSMVHFHGYQEEPWKILSNIDFFLLTSLYEGFGNVLVEAMTLGKPVVAYDSPYGPREIVKDRETGFLVSVGDEVALEQAVRYLLGNEVARKRFSENARRVSLQFEPEISAKTFSEACLPQLYSAALNGAGRRLG